MLQGGKDYDIVKIIDEELGLRELRAKVNGAAGITEDDPPNRFSVFAELCYHPKSIEVMRKYLDSGILAQYLYEEYEKKDRCWSGYDYRRYHTLVACAMTLGCKIPEHVLEKMHGMQNPAYVQAVRQKNSKYALPRLANTQLKEALAQYKAGEPYDFGNTTMLEASMANMIRGTTTIKNVGQYKVVEVKQKNGNVIPQMIGPPDDEEMGLKPIYPNHLCAACGADDKDDGKELSCCARCKDRKYCSKECQKAHWKMHKVICTKPADQMAAFMESIKPIYFGGSEGAEAAMGDIPVVFMS